MAGSGRAECAAVFGCPGRFTGSLLLRPGVEAALRLPFLAPLLLPLPAVAPDDKRGGRLLLEAAALDCAVRGRGRCDAAALAVVVAEWEVGRTRMGERGMPPRTRPAL